MMVRILRIDEGTRINDVAGCARKHFWSSWRMKPSESTDHCLGYLIFQYKASEHFLDSSKSFTKFEYIGRIGNFTKCDLLKLFSGGCAPIWVVQKG